MENEKIIWNPLTQRTPKSFVNRSADLNNILAALILGQRKEGFIPAYPTPLGMVVSVTAQKAFVPDGLFAITITIHAVQEDPILFRNFIGPSYLACI